MSISVSNNMLGSFIPAMEKVEAKKIKKNKEKKEQC